MRWVVLVADAATSMTPSMKNRSQSSQAPVHGADPLQVVVVGVAVALEIEAQVRERSRQDAL